MVAYDRDRKLFFIHIPKNAGKSVSLALGLVPEAHFAGWRWRSIPNRAATWTQRVTRDRLAMERLWGVVDYTLAAQHLTYSETYLLGLLEPETLAEATKFAVSRNPYDRAVSMFFHLRPGEERSPKHFEDFLLSLTGNRPRDHGIRAMRRPQVEFFLDLHGHSVLDCLLRYESLEADLPAFARRYLGRSVEVPWLGRQRGALEYRALYSAEARKIVTSFYEEDLSYFGYDF